MWWLIATWISGLAGLAAALGTLVPLQHPDGIEYIFVPPALRLFSAFAGALTVLLAAIFTLVSHMGRSRSADIGLVRSGRWLAPWSASVLLVLGLLPVVPGIGEHGAVWGYFFYDLRWWWLAVLSALVAANVDTLLGGAMARRVRALNQPPGHPRVLSVAVFLIAVVWAIVTTPLTRFDGFVTGDEPRYLRYCELWYEGGGMDVSRVHLVSEEPAGRGPALLGNVRHAARAITSGVPLLAADLEQAARHPLDFKWNRARVVTEGFVRGIHGGSYQVIEAGTSVILFPGYVVDRYFSRQAGDEGKFPAALPMTNVTMLVTYGLVAVALFRLLRSVLRDDLLAVCWAVIGTLTMPMTAFAFQFYPELPVLAIVLAVTRYLWFSTSTRMTTAALAGAAAGSLAWFHPRFLLLMLGFLVVNTIRRAGRPRLVFFAGFCAALFTLCAYDYHVTGSWLPTAVWDATGEGVHFNDSSTIFNLIGYGIDRTWGLFPHALILTLVFAGLVVLARRTPAQAWFVGAMTLSLTTTASAHTLSAAGTTPDRLIVAIVPLMFWPIAVLVRAYWTSTAMRTLTTTLVVMSLDAAFAYNGHHDNSAGPIHDASVIGWKPNVAFPVMRGEVWTTSRPNFELFLGVAAVLAMGSLIAIRMARADRPSRPAGFARAFASRALVVALVVLMFTAATAPNEDWTTRAFLLNREEARDRAAHALADAGPCRWCVSSLTGHVDAASFRP